MSYSTGDLIEATDYNNLRNLAAQVYGVGFGNSGYGQTSISLPPVSGGDTELVKSVEWTNLRDAIQVCADHQGTTVDLPPPGQLAVGALIRAHTASDNTGDIPTSIDDITTNRLNADSGSLTTFTSQLVSTRNSGWSSQIRHEFTVTFPTVDDARYFFNSGGQIRIRASRTGGSGTAQNAAWTNLLNNMGTVSFDYTGVYAAVGTASPIGYYDLGGSNVLIYDLDDTAANYNANSVQIFGRYVDGPGGANGDNGRILRFRVNYNDGSGGFTDNVNGTFTSTVDIRRATTHLSIPAPVLATITDLSSGS